MNSYNNLNWIDNIRICRLCLRYLKYKGVQVGMYNSEDISSCINELKKVEANVTRGDYTKDQFWSELKAACADNILSESSFSWFANNERAAFWLWGYLYSIDDIALGIPCINMLGDNYRNWYQRLQLTTTPSNHEERVRIIETYFDKIIVGIGSGLKKMAMENLKMKWSAIFNEARPIKWLPNDEESSLWAWDNIKKQHEFLVEAGKPRFSLSLEDDRHKWFAAWFRPVNAEEQRLAICAAFDLWETEIASKKLFLINLNKAWNQRKLRRTRADKKALNTYLKNGTKLKLDLLAEHGNMRVSDVLEKMINEYYEALILANRKSG